MYCQGYIADALLECVPSEQRAHPSFKLLFNARPGVAFACPYCDGLIAFDEDCTPVVPQSGWKVFRYGKANLELKKLADGEPASVSLADWALRHRFIIPGTHQPFAGYIYAEQAPIDEVVT